MPTRDVSHPRPSLSCNVFPAVTAKFDRISLFLCWALLALIALAVPTLGWLDLPKPPPAPVDVNASYDDEFLLAYPAKYTYGLYKLSPETFGRNAGLLRSLERNANAEPAREPARVIAGIVKADVEGAPAGAAWFREDDTNYGRWFYYRYQYGRKLSPRVVRAFGYFGELAETTGQPDASPARASLISEATRFAVVLLAFICAILLAGVVGTGLLITAVVLLSSGTLRCRLPPTLAPTAPHLQAFSLYLLLLLAPEYVLALAGHAWTLWPLLGLAAGGFAVALAWALFRIPFQTLRQNCGLHLGRGPLVEIGAGAVGYLACLPLLALGLATSMLLGKLTGHPFSHPLFASVQDRVVPTAFAAVVLAPVTEEFMFRGLLLSHLRARLGPFLAAALSALLFASIHPQGLVGIPAIFCMGLSFALIRQWRASLIPSIAAHALNNGAITYVYFLLMT